MPRTPRTPKEQPSPLDIPGPAWLDKFLTALIKSGGAIAPACKAAKVGRSTVYDEIRRNPALAEAIDDMREVAVELVEGTLFQCAMNPASTTDRIFFLKTRRPEVYGDKLRQDQVDQIKQEARRQTLGELEDEIARLPDGARSLVLAALADLANKKELPA